MGRLSLLLNYFFTFCYINNVFDSKHLINIITPKSLKCKRKLRRLRETGPCTPYESVRKKFLINSEK